ncbi:PREDICTED: galaxin-2-like [Priapulus caudatus]|uniref:Galaxin-2-like n=1 Tax=Priapulus caudatus TaxID=37621 RepID=A0ABM1DTU5_PRICU|nr:PREDICTED: galaxin-2-like [Priapulus caudatus]
MTWRGQTKAVCCSGQVAFGDSCCGDVAYDTTTHICCHDNLQERLTDGVTACCDNRVIDTTANLCCDGQVHEATPGLECCGADAYDPANQECVDDELVKVCTGESCEIGADIADEEYFSPYPYCGFTHYDPDAGEVCCQGVITSGALCCGTRGYSPKLLMCCDGVLHERIGLDTVVYGEERDLQCCGNAIP